MLVWPALLVAPLIALGQLSIAYSLVTPACGRQDSSVLHAVAAVSLVLVLVMTAMAWRAWRRSEPTSNPGAASAAGIPAVTAAEVALAARRPQFLALVALLVGALSALVSIAIWLPVWFLSPCT